MAWPQLSHLTFMSILQVRRILLLLFIYFFHCGKFLFFYNSLLCLTYCPHLVALVFLIWDKGSDDLTVGGLNPIPSVRILDAQVN